jgi:hypothetical protein
MLGSVVKSTIRILLWCYSPSTRGRRQGWIYARPNSLIEMVEIRREHRRTYCRRGKRLGKLRGSPTMGCRGGALTRRGGLGSPRLVVTDGDPGAVCASARDTFARPAATSVHRIADRCHQPRLRSRIRQIRDRCAAHTGGRSSCGGVTPVRRRRAPTRLGPQTTTRAAKRHCTRRRGPDMHRKHSVPYSGHRCRRNNSRCRAFVAFRMASMRRAMTISGKERRHDHPGR